MQWVWGMGFYGIDHDQLMPDLHKNWLKWEKNVHLVPEYAQCILAYITLDNRLLR